MERARSIRKAGFSGEGFHCLHDPGLTWPHAMPGPGYEPELWMLWSTCQALMLNVHAAISRSLLRAAERP